MRAEDFLQERNVLRKAELEVKTKELALQERQMTQREEERRLERDERTAAPHWWIVCELLLKILENKLLFFLQILDTEYFRSTHFPFY